MDKAKDLLGSNLKRLREMRKWTQAELAEAAHLSVQMIQKIEYGKTAPSPTTLDSLAKALGTTHADLFAGSADQSSTRNDPNWQELSRVLQSYLGSAQDRRLLALYILTDDEHYLAQYEELPDAPRISAILKKVL